MSKFVELNVKTGVSRAPDKDWQSDTTDEKPISINAELIQYFCKVPYNDGDSARYKPQAERWGYIVLKPEGTESIKERCSETSLEHPKYPNTLLVANNYKDLKKQLGVK